MEHEMILEEKIDRLSVLARNLERNGADFEEIKKLILKEAEGMNIRPVGSEPF
jgi:5-enolpyruvylshikimate-3-phosphate synthase